MGTSRQKKSVIETGEIRFHMLDAVLSRNFAQVKDGKAKIRLSSPPSPPPHQYHAWQRTTRRQGLHYFFSAPKFTLFSNFHSLSKPSQSSFPTRPELLPLVGLAATMRASHLLALLFYATIIIAGGYQGCLERIWLFKAYEIEGLNSGPHSLSWKCRAWDEPSNSCRNNEWVECRGRRAASPRCDFGEFIQHLGGPESSIAWAVPATGEMNVVQTAEECVYRFGRRRGIPNTPPFKIMKGTTEWNDMI
jgi:hypothetical protein